MAIIGFGCAGFRALQAIRNAGSTASVDVYSETNLPPYNPMLTTYYVSGRLPYQGMFPFGSLDEIRKKYHANILSETTITRIDTTTRCVYTENGQVRQYDKILISTGARAFVPQNLSHLQKAVCMRTVSDARNLHNILERQSIRSAVIVGASMVGIKVAELLHQRGCTVTLVDMAQHIFSLAAYPEVSEKIEARLAKIGIRLEFGKAIADAQEDPNTGRTRIRLSDGAVLETELLVLNVGTRASINFLDANQIMVDKGILVNERMESSAAGVFAAGDCCQANNLQSGQPQIIGLWASAAKQGRVAGYSMVGKYVSLDGNIPHNITHFFDMDFIALGDNHACGETLRLEDNKKGFYLQAVLNEGRPVGYNILDNYGVSGILKEHLMNSMREKQNHFTPEQRGQLVRYGLNDTFIDRLEAVL